jgi:hypothetical protein
MTVASPMRLTTTIDASALGLSSAEGLTLDIEVPLLEDDASNLVRPPITPDEAGYRGGVVPWTDDGFSVTLGGITKSFGGSGEAISGATGPAGGYPQLISLSSDTSDNFTYFTQAYLPSRSDAELLIGDYYINSMSFTFASAADIMFPDQSQNGWATVDPDFADRAEDVFFSLNLVEQNPAAGTRRDRINLSATSGTLTFPDAVDQMAFTYWDDRNDYSSVPTLASAPLVAAPLPAALPMLLVGLFGLFGLKRRRTS